MITPYKQIYPAQCPILAKLGFQSLVNLRFDNECDNQPTSHEIAIAAQNAGLDYHHFPVDGDQITNSQVQDFVTLINSLPSPIMVFCNSGNRAKKMYQNAKIQKLID